MPDRDLMTRLNEASPELSRRSLMKWAAAGAGAATFGPLIGRLQAFAAPPVGPRDGILVLIQMSGGNDGLNTLCPIGDGRYYDLRGDLAIQPHDALSVGSGLGLHPSLTHLKHLYDLGQVAIVRGVGYTPPDLSHFTSMGTWMQGWAGAPQSLTTGWAGRLVDNFPNAASEGLYSVTIGSSVPPHLVGQVSRASGLPLDIGNAFGISRTDPNDVRLYDAIASYGSGSTGLGAWGDLVGSTDARLMTLTQEIQPAYQGTVPDGDFERQLTLCARLINANLGIRVLNTELGSFDTHADQASTQADLFADLDAGINAFFANLHPGWAGRVTLLTFSEFGRRPEANDGGTDHGTASVVFVVGSRVNGGLHGQQPSLATNGLDQYGNLIEHVDFRNVYADIVSKWFGADEVEVVGKNYPQLDLFRSGPGTATPPATPTQVSGTGYWVATTTGAIANAGSAPAKTGLHSLAAPIVGGDVTPTDRGFWLVASDGGISSFGDAAFHGSTGAIHLNRPIVGMASTPTGHGYWLVASDGGIFCFGDAGFHGAAVGAIPAPARVLRRSASGRGYWILAADGTVRAYGDAHNYGSTRAPGAVAFLPAHG